MSISHFFKKITSVFFKIKVIQNPTSLFFRQDELVNCSATAELSKHSPVLPKMFQ